jgi:hypothetical protein
MEDNSYTMTDEEKEYLFYEINDEQERKVHQILRNNDMHMLNTILEKVSINALKRGLITADGWNKTPLDIILDKPLIIQEKIKNLFIHHYPASPELKDLLGWKNDFQK